MRELRSLLPYLKPYRSAYLLGLALVVTSNFFATKESTPSASPASFMPFR
jgi:hypothetical protein